jgi:hypothetical protein
VYRRAYALLVGTAVFMGVSGIVVAHSLGRTMVDPDGFLGPSWLRLPMLLGAAFILDLLRTLVVRRHQLLQPKVLIRARIREHWGRERLALVVLGLVSFYVTYVSYRNLKSFLPFVEGDDHKFDRELDLVDHALTFGHSPGVALHDLLGTGISADFLSLIYLWFLPLVPLALIAWLTWGRNLSYGYWFATSQVLAWTFGTISYYMLPTLGPGFSFAWRYQDVVHTPSGALMQGLSHGRNAVLQSGIEGSVQSVAGFASLHCAITLLFALMVQYTIRSRLLHWIFWVNFSLTIVATLYFGWHYIADDIAGILIALLSFYLGGLASGQKFERGGLASHPTTTTSAVPVDRSAKAPRPSRKRESAESAGH